MRPILDEYWKSDNTESIWPVLRLMIMDPIDRRNVNEWLGHEDAWLDKYKPKDQKFKKIDSNKTFEPVWT